jgi:hypothetical protein
MDELELSDAVVGLKIKLASGVSCAERNLFNLFSDFEDMWQAEQDAEGMNNDIDLTRETLNLGCGHKHFVRGGGGRGNRLRLRHDGHGWRHFPRARYPDYELGGSAPRCSCDGRIQSSQFSCGAGWRLRDAQIPPARAPMVARRCGDRRPVRSDVWEPLLARECASLRADRNSRYFGLQANAIMTMLSLANPASSSSPFSFYEESTSF